MTLRDRISPTLPPGTADWPARANAAVVPMAVASPGEGWAAFAARVRGYDPAVVPWRTRERWAEELQRANGNPGELRAGHSYRVPWFAVTP